MVLLFHSADIFHAGNKVRGLFAVGRTGPSHGQRAHRQCRCARSRHSRRLQILQHVSWCLLRQRACAYVIKYLDDVGAHALMSLNTLMRLNTLMTSARMRICH